MPLSFGMSGPARTLSIAGELDLETADELVARVQAQGDAGDVILDAEELTFVDSSGVRALLRAADALSGHGKLVLRHPSPAVRRVLELMGLMGSHMGLVVQDGAVPVQDGQEHRSYPADRRVLAEIRRFVRSRAMAGPVAEWADNIVLAVSEACANAILHSGTPEISVSWRAFEERAEVEVRDEGIFRRAVPSEADGTSSRGILLMLAVMDQITITCGTDARPGTVVRMVKLKDGSIRDRRRGRWRPESDDGLSAAG
jgi:anti-anti-sigma factor